MTNLANDTKLQTSLTEWRYRYNPFGEREQKRMYNSPLGDMGYEMYLWVYYQLGIDNKQYAVYYGAQTNNSYVNMSNITMTAKPDPTRETVFFYPVEYNVYGNESSPKITYKYVDGYWQKQYKIYDYLGSLRYTISQMNKVLNYKAYDPYGNELIDTLKQTRQGYIGKENDVENGLGDHGVRKYDPGTGRFNSGEPLSDKFPGISPYVYCFNNPIRLIDWNGFGPGDPFKTADVAAKDFALTYNSASINNSKEFGTTLYSFVSKNDGQTYITYIVPIPGGAAGTSVGEAPNGTTRVATAHTHGSYDPALGLGNDVFSMTDLNNATKRGVPSYVVTPSGSLQKFDPKNGKIAPVKGTNNIPSDPSDPDRINHKSPKSKDTNEQPEMLPNKQLPNQK